MSNRRLPQSEVPRVSRQEAAPQPQRSAMWCSPDPGSVAAQLPAVVQRHPAAIPPEHAERFLEGAMSWVSAWSRASGRPPDRPERQGPPGNHIVVTINAQSVMDSSQFQSTQALIRRVRLILQVRRRRSATTRRTATHAARTPANTRRLLRPGIWSGGASSDESNCGAGVGFPAPESIGEGRCCTGTEAGVTD